MTHLVPPLAVVSLIACGTSGGSSAPDASDLGDANRIDDARGEHDAVVDAGPAQIHALVASKTELASSLFPVAVGLAWTYDIDNGTTTCSSGPRTIRYRERTTSNGQTIYSLDPTCDYFAPGANKIWVVGDDVMSQVHTGAASKVLSMPIEQGGTWSINATVTGDWIRETAPVAVPGGAFDDCWTVHSTPWDSWATYCRGVGLVKARSLSGGGATGFGFELLSYDFSALP